MATTETVTDPKTGQPIYPGYQQGPGLHNASSYQVSAIPYVTGNILAPPFNGVGSIPGHWRIDFPSVTSWFKVDNLDPLHELRVGFSEFGTAASGTYGGNYITVQSATGSWNTTGELPLKVRSLYVRSSNILAPASFQVIAGLTQIHHNLSASEGLNWSGSAGVG